MEHPSTLSTHCALNSALQGAHCSLCNAHLQHTSLQCKAHYAHYLISDVSFYYMEHPSTFSTPCALFEVHTLHMAPDLMFSSIFWSNTFCTLRRAPCTICNAHIIANTLLSFCSADFAVLYILQNWDSLISIIPARIQKNTNVFTYDRPLIVITTTRSSIKS